MKARATLPVLLGLWSASMAAACGSSGVADYHSYGGGGPATVAPSKSDAGNGGNGAGSSGSSGSSGAGSSGSSGAGSSSGGSSSGGDAGATGFGNVDVASFTLVDTAITTLPAGAPITGFDPIQYGATFDLAMVGDQLSMSTRPPQVAIVGSMAFALDATFTHTANTSPYSLCGDDGKGTFNPCPIGVGKHTLTVTVYPEPDLKGTPYQPPTMLEFYVVDSQADAGSDGPTE